MSFFWEPSNWDVFVKHIRFFNNGKGLSPFLILSLLVAFHLKCRVSGGTGDFHYKSVLPRIQKSDILFTPLFTLHFQFLSHFHFPCSLLLFITFFNKILKLPGNQICDNALVFNSNMCFFESSPRPLSLYLFALPIYLYAYLM